MLLFVIVEGIASIYGAAYAWHCIRRRRMLGAVGALLLCTLSAAMGVLVFLFVT